MISLGGKWTWVPLVGGNAVGLFCSTGTRCTLFFRLGCRPAWMRCRLDAN